MSDNLLTAAVVGVLSALGGGGGATAWYRARLEKGGIEANSSLIEAQVAKTVQEVYGATVAHQAAELVELRTDLTAATGEIDKLQREVRLLRSEKDLSNAHLKDALAVVDHLLVHDAQHEHTEDLPAPAIPRTLQALIEREAI